jgi:hypothetical protein
MFRFLFPLEFIVKYAILLSDLLGIRIFDLYIVDLP